MFENINKFFRKEGEKYENHINSIVIIKEENQKLDTMKFLNILKEQYRFEDGIELKSIIKSKSKKNSFYFDVNNIKCEMNFINTGYFDNSIQKACSNAYHWKEALNEIQSSKGHIIITVSNKVSEDIKNNNALKNNLFLTMVTGALSELLGATAVLWKASNLINKGSEFSKVTKEKLDGFLPIELWIDFGLERSLQYKYSLFTRGLEVFTKKEIEIRDRLETPEELAIFAYNFVYFIVRNNVILADKMKLSGENNKIIYVEEGRSMFDKTKNVLVLKY